MTDKVVIKGLRVFGYHGIHKEERERGQNFTVDVEVGLDLRRPGETDRIEDTLDYDQLVMDIQSIVSKEQFNLLEGLAERIAGLTLQRGPAQSVRVRIAKTDPPIDADIEMVGVEVLRTK